jgi:hypothetical protein
MTLDEALHSPDLLQGLMAAPTSVKRLVFWAIWEIDKQRAAKRNPTLVAMMEAVPTDLIQSVVADNRAGRPEPRPMVEMSRGTGWQDNIGFPDRSRDFEMLDRIVESQVGGPNDTSRLK